MLILITELSRFQAASNDFPHLLFYGPSGAGKKTRVMAFLRELYGAASINKLRFEHMDMKAPSGAKVELRAVATNYHIDVTPRYAPCRKTTKIIQIHQAFIVLLSHLYTGHQLTVKISREFDRGKYI